ncbi:helix-turn-helix domain-containing protein [Kitasatospora sp. NPDC004799]|uniref:ArsR/SmtB family transcription factor n=1 Tax=Kitasatospora sp. NPDC004799 TaxID=3154460 RepID=UPI0033A8E1D3
MVEDGVWEALADPVRRLILDGLAERGGQSLFEVCVRLTSRHGVGVSREAVGRHLGVLEEAGLVRVRREGRCTVHDLNTEPLERIAARWLRPDPTEDAP